MPIIKNPVHGRLPLPVPEEPSKKPSLLEMVKEAIDENNITIDIPELKDVFESGDYVIPNDYLKRGPTSYYSKDNTFTVPSITDFARLTAKDCHEPMFYMRDPLSDIWNRIAIQIGIQHDEKKFVYVDKHGKVKLSDPKQKYSRDFIIQPIFSFAGCPEVFNLLTNNGKDEYVYF